MELRKISKNDFYKYSRLKDKSAWLHCDEVSMFEDLETDEIGTIVKSTDTNDWSFEIHSKDDWGGYTLTYRGGIFDNQEIAEQDLYVIMERMIYANKVQKKHIEQVWMPIWEKWEQLYIEENGINKLNQSILITDINEEVKKYLKKYPEKLYDLSSRKFEELVASILEDMGLDVELTKKTRDGGCDIIAYLKNSLTSFLILIECKKYSMDNKVGVNIIRQVAGVQMRMDASKSIIVTTSSFTKDAIEETKLLKQKIDLKDYQNLKEWLSKY